MNTLVAIASTLIVVGVALYGLHVLLGQWSVLMWAGLAWAVFIGVCRRINS